ncbi:MAG TPA: tetratricopeptide repeat protein [Vicinamibacterales bacterium]|nr:tetratricopeptide repeat protein [Vicinamibacterales bacterium]
MPTKTTGTSVARVPDRAIRHQLNRILASKTFSQVDRLKRFVSFIVLETVDGRGGELKEYVIGVQVFGKEPSFDPRTDPIVRVQARRLRARLVRYYREEGPSDDVIVDLPKGGYTPIFRRREAAPPTKPSLTATLVSRNTVAVLPFADHTPGGACTFFCRGLREEIVHALARLKTLRVLAWQGDGSSEDPERARGRGDAALIVSGSVRPVGADQFRVTTQLVDGPSGYYLWSESIDVTPTDGVAAQEAVAHAIVAKLEPELEHGEHSMATRTGSDNLAARNLYLQGRYHLNQRTEEGLHKAVEFFEKALVEDAQYALAHSGLADAYGLLAHYGALGPADVWAKAASSAASAVMLDGLAAEAHTSLAHVRSTQDWDWPGSEREFQRAIQLNRRYPTAHHWYAMSCLVPMGRLDEALEHMLLAQSLDPVSSIIARDVAVIYGYRRDFEAALDQCDQTIELNPHFAPAYLTLGLIQEQRKDFDESAAAFRRALDLSPNTPRMHGALARTFALSGKHDEARATLQTLEALAHSRYVSPFEFLSIHFALGEIDKGFAWLTKACEDRCFELLALKVDPRFEALRDDQRFTAIVSRVGLG